jgi:hypothetical protein
LQQSDSKQAVPPVSVAYAEDEEKSRTYMVAIVNEMNKTP